MPDWQVIEGDCVDAMRAMDEASFLWWLAGFIDGEGCFRIQHERHRGYCAPRFSLKQRDDDASLLIAIVERTGIGRVKFDTARSGGSRPCAVWVAESRADTQALVALLDEATLLTRKGRDYTIWRDAVLHLAGMTRGNRWHGPRDWTTMLALRDRLMDGRRYVGRG